MDTITLPEIFGMSPEDAKRIGEEMAAIKDDGDDFGLPWVSCGEELPEEDGEYLVWLHEEDDCNNYPLNSHLATGPCSSMALWQYDEWTIKHNDIGEGPIKVTPSHWLKVTPPR